MGILAVSAGVIGYRCGRWLVIGGSVANLCFSASEHRRWRFYRASYAQRIKRARAAPRALAHSRTLFSARCLARASCLPRNRYQRFGLFRLCAFCCASASPRRARFHITSWRLQRAIVPRIKRDASPAAPTHRFPRAACRAARIVSRAALRVSRRASSQRHASASAASRAQRGTSRIAASHIGFARAVRYRSVWFAKTCLGAGWRAHRRHNKHRLLSICTLRRLPAAYILRYHLFRAA